MTGSSETNATSMLECWRAPREAGEPLGCLSTTYTFHPGLFDEQCLGRFLEIESDPDREDLAFLLERESRLGSVYAGVMVDHTQAGVEHSLRWDLLPIRIPVGKQHAKLSVLAWAKHVRLIVSSANLTEPGYRLNQEVCQVIDSRPEEAELGLVCDAVEFLRRLLAFVPGAAPDRPETVRATAFLDQVVSLVGTWTAAKPVRGQWQHLVFTLPGCPENPATAGFKSTGSLETALEHCGRRGGKPEAVWIASPFFDDAKKVDPTTQTLCRSMGRGGDRYIEFCVPPASDFDAVAPRLAAPECLVATAKKYAVELGVSALPTVDADGEGRIWHAKMLSLVRNQGRGYTALMIGSSNFTGAGMGTGPARNAEANLLTIAAHLPRARLPNQVAEIWPATDAVEELTKVEWLGGSMEEPDEAGGPVLPPGFLPASFRAGGQAQLVLRFDPEGLPQSWTISDTRDRSDKLIDSRAWEELGRRDTAELAWESEVPPEKLVVQWKTESGEAETFLPLNVEDASALPAPADLSEVSAEEMLRVLAASDPGAVIRGWPKRPRSGGGFDPELDVSRDLDPLTRYDLRDTFLRRVRRRAVLLSRLRGNLQRPVFSGQSLQWRLEGFLGVRALAQKYAEELAGGVAGVGQEAVDESVLTLADLVILLGEVEYEAEDGALPETEFVEVYGAFLAQLLDELESTVQQLERPASPTVLGFWNRVVERCRERTNTSCLAS